MSHTLEITKRENHGTNMSRKLRHEGFTPGVIYGKDSENILVQVDKKELSRLCSTVSMSGRIFDVSIDGKEFRVLSRDIQYDVVTDEPIHIDFQKISSDTTIKVSVPLEFINDDKAPGIKRGGVLNVVLHKVDCICRVDNIPEKLQIDLTGGEIGDSIHISKISLPEGVKFSYKNSNIVAATIVTSKNVVSAEAGQ